MEVEMRGETDRDKWSEKGKEGFSSTFSVLQQYGCSNWCAFVDIVQLMYWFMICSLAYVVFEWQLLYHAGPRSVFQTVWLLCIVAVCCCCNCTYLHACMPWLCIVCMNCIDIRKYFVCSQQLINCWFNLSQNVITKNKFVNKWIKSKHRRIGQLYWIQFGITYGCCVLGQLCNLQFIEIVNRV